VLFPDGSFGRYRIIEFSVFEHFGPYSAVDAPSEVFDELAVDVR
jgi:hypothetical protein